MQFNNLQVSHVEMKSLAFNMNEIYLAECLSGCFEI